MTLMKWNIVALLVLLALATGCESSKSSKPSTDGTAENAKVESNEMMETAKKAGMDAANAAADYVKPGFKVFMEDGRLWVFEEGSEALAEFQRVGEPAKSVTLVGAGPNGLTLRGAEREVLDRYRKAWGL